MKKGFTKFFTILTALLTLGISTSWADNVTLSAADMVAGSTKSHITPDAGAGAAVSEQQVWLDGSTKKKYDCLQLSSASGTGEVLGALKTKSVFFTVDAGYKITGLTVSGASNKDASNTAPIVMACWTGDVSRTPALIAQITLPHRQTSSLPSVAASSIPAGTKTIALYRRVKVNNTTTPTELVASGGSDYGSSNTGNLVSVTISYEALAPATKHTVTYDLNGGSGTTPTQADVAEGAKFTLHDGVTGITAPSSTKVFAGWNDGSATYAGGADYTMGTSDVTLTAQWSDKYTVTYDKNGGDGTMADTYNEIVACTFTAPDGKAFKEWNTQADGNGTTYVVGATVTGDLDLFAIWVKAPQVLFHYQWTGSGTQPSIGDVLNGTGGTITVERKEGSTKTLSNEGAAFKAGVPDDMKFSGSTSKGIKFGTSDVYFHIALTSGKFKMGDTIKICGYESFMVSSSDASSAGSGDISSGFATGADKNNYDVAWCVIPDVEDCDLYVRRTSNSCGFAAIKVIRPVKYDVNFDKNDAGASGSMEAVQYPAGAEVTLPACTFTAPDTKEFDAWVSDDVTITAGKFTMPANDVTIKATWKAEATKYDITYYPGANGSGSIAAGKKTEDVDFVLSSERFTRAGYLQTGWATVDGGAQAYALGATYTANAALDLYPVWTELTTYDAPFACDDDAPAGWTFANNGWADNEGTVAYVCKFHEHSISAPHNNGMSDDAVAFAKSSDAIATYDLGITTSVAVVSGTFYVGSSSAKTFNIDYLAADGSTVLHTITVNHPASSNWGEDDLIENAVVDNVRYIKITGIGSWVVMEDFSVQYIETRPQYNVEFAAGTYGTGTMATRKYIEAATVTAPDCGFGTSDATKEFDKWSVSGLAGITELAAGETFAMPTNTVTLTALWRVATTKYTVTYYDGATELGSEEVAEGSNPAEYATYQDKANHVFLGWFNDADLAPAHAVDDISAEVINDAANYYGKWALDLQVTKIVFSNGFDAFIDKDAQTVKAYYMSGESAPTMTSYEANANVKADGVTIVGNKVVLTGTDDSEIEYDLTIEAVAPMTSFDKQTFDGNETYIKGGSGFAPDRGWKFQKNADDGRIPKGLTRLYVFLGGGADKATFKSYAKRAVHVYVNNVLVSSVTELPSNAEFDIPLDPNDATNMIAFISNQTGGDAGIFDVKLNEHTISSDATLGALTVNGDAVALVDGVFEYDVELAYGTSSAPTIVATANDAGAVATVVSCTLSGATIEVVPESGASDKKTYTLTFTVSRYPKIIIWDGATMSAVATSPDASGLEWAVTGFGSIANYSVSLDGKDYVKCLPSGGNGGATRNISLTIPDGYVGRVTIVFGSHSDDERGMFIGKAATKTLDETSILTLYSPGRTSLVKGTSLWSGGTYYINPMASVDFYEITVELTPGYARTDMLGAGVLGTICVDHNVAINEAFGASFYELAGKEATYGKIVFEEIIAGELEAGKPYVFQAEGNLIALLYGSTEVSSPVNTGALKGTFTGELFTAEQAAEKDIYFFRDHALWSAKETGLQVLANRAWLEMGSVGEFSNPSPAPGRRYIMLGTNGQNQAQGIDDVQDDVRSTKMLIDGRLFILRGEKIYDATGRLVK